MDFDIEFMNQSIIDGIANSLNDGFEAAFSYVNKLYDNDGGNDFFVKSRAALESALFRLLLYRYMCKRSDIDLKRFVLEDEYYSENRKILIDDWSEYMGTEMTPAIVHNMAVMCADRKMPERFFKDVSEDIEVCFWTWLAATMGNAKSMNNMGILYVQGMGVKQSRPMAYYWFLRGAELLEADAIFSLGTALVKIPLMKDGNVEYISQIMLKASGEIKDNFMAQKFVRNNVQVLMDIIKEEYLIYNCI